MAIPLYLAMTAAEFSYAADMPESLAWMACHFSPGGSGLVNLPKVLPPGSLLILDDQTPPAGHDIDRIRRQLSSAVREFDCCGILLDFQRPGNVQTAKIAEALVGLPCPVGVSDIYAASLDCPVFLPAPELNRLLRDHLSPWTGREMWLEAATDSVCLTVTEKGCSIASQPYTDGTDFPCWDGQLHCHYRIECSETSASFSLRRTKADLSALLQDAAQLGVTKAVGLWQELN